MIGMFGRWWLNRGFWEGCCMVCRKWWWVSDCGWFGDENGGVFRWIYKCI